MFRLEFRGSRATFRKREPCRSEVGKRVYRRKEKERIHVHVFEDSSPLDSSPFNAFSKYRIEEATLELEVEQGALYYVAANIRIDRANKLVEETTRETELWTRANFTLITSTVF